MYLIGFLVNPIAGMGGSVGLKGTDGLVMEAIRRGAIPGAVDRAIKTLKCLKGGSYRFYTCSGTMGEEAIKKAGISEWDVIRQTPSKTTGMDTRAACRAFLEAGVNLILFCGGDGTARDVYDVVKNKVPILGIPAGVKMYSAVFAINPEAAAEILLQSPNLFKGANPPLRDAEVVDVDEEAYRRGELKTRLYGFAKTPYIPGLVQGTKQVFEEQEEERAKEAIGRFLSEVMKGTPDILYILGPGTTTEAIARQCDIKKTLLGFDAIKDTRLLKKDLNESDMLDILKGEGKTRLIVSIIGAQGSVLGRGTQAVSPLVIRKIGVENILIVATPHKLTSTPLLFFDTGDSELDRAFGNSISVISGYRLAQRKKVG
ncbi:MAG TPA: ATP-NAD kinase family protein [Methanoregulaceae archaeon]|nr:ATP-NAD kinase family protein [Methanoregulaceae archaeon]